MLQFILVGLSKWLVSSLFGGYVYTQAEKKFGRDEFQSISDRALQEVLKEEDNRIIWNRIMEKTDLRIRDPTEFDFSQVFNWFSGEDTILLQTLFKALQKEYLKELHKIGEKDPVTKYLLKEVEKLADHEARIRTLEAIYPEILEFSEKYRLLKERLKNIKTVIEKSRLDIRNFVGRNEIIKTLPEGDVFIEGKAAFGKTYLLLKLCELCNGCYIPLDIITERQILELLHEEAKAEKKRIFIDDFHRATPEIQQYVQGYIPDVVLSSREKPTIRRDFTYIELTLLDKEDIREYFSFYNIEIKEEPLKFLKNDLNFPIKLRIFVNYCIRCNISYLDTAVLKEILKNLGLKKFQLPDKLSEFYRTLVFNLFDKDQRNLCYFLSLLRFPASVGRLSELSDLSPGEVSTLMEKMMGVLNVHEGTYAIFHETFTEFCLLDMGDTRKWHERIGSYFEEAIGTDIDLEARIEEMYHYRKAGSKDAFERVFDLSIASALHDAGLWNEAREDLEFALRTSVDDKERADTLLVLGIILHKMGEWNKAMASYDECQVIFQELEDAHGMAQTYGNMGLVYYRKGEWDKAIEYYKKDLEIFERLGDVHGVAITQYNMAHILRDQKKYDEALNLYSESEVVFKTLGDKLNLMKVYYNLAICHADMNQEEKAARYYDKAERLKKQFGIS
jgi:tetratricopeptide (TPR) repeat protein